MGPAGLAWLDFQPDADADGDWAERYGGGDCDDSDGDVSSLADERCNGIDDDCDSEIDEDSATDASAWYLDADGDGWGDLEASPLIACDPPEGAVSTLGDCDDSAADISPEAEERCNGLDDNCDGDVDEGVTTTAWTDADGDGYGDPSAPVELCSEEEGTADNMLDCDDSEAAISPEAEDLPGDGVDQDCDGADATSEDSGGGGDSAGPTDSAEPDTDPPAEDSGDAPLPTEEEQEGGDTYTGGKDCGCASGTSGPLSSLLPAALAGLLPLLRRRGPPRPTLRSSSAVKPARR
jgi:hypothetical protein